MIASWAETWELIPRVVASVVVVLAAALDISRNRVPNLLTFPAAAVGILLGAVRGGVAGFGLAVAGLAAGVALLFVPFALREIHGGDVKLLGAVGALLGPWRTLWAFLLFSVFGGLFAVAMLVLTRRGRAKLRILWAKFKNFVFSRDFRVLRRSGEEDRIYLPYAVPIAIGTIAAILTEGVLY